MPCPARITQRRSQGHPQGSSRMHPTPVHWRFALILIVLCLTGCNDQPLHPWHTEVLSTEFTAARAADVPTFEDYLRLEERIFAELMERIVAPTPTGPAQTLVRYSRGSAADPEKQETNWNRSFELPAESPIGGVLLLHGMSDSPYSLRTIGQRLSRSGYWVIGLRLPGHGTAPSGLLDVLWEDMAAAVRLAAAHLTAKVGSQPIHLIGYSTGASLALDFTLDALEDKVAPVPAPVPASLVLISPAIGLHPTAALAVWMRRLSQIPGLRRLAWLTIELEFDPFTYNSFTTNAGEQVYRLTQVVARRVEARARIHPELVLPPTLVIVSNADATVSNDAVVDRLLGRLEPHHHELVLFDINRCEAKSILFVTDPGSLATRVLGDDGLPFSLTLVTNESPESQEVVAHHQAPFSDAFSRTEPLGKAWPAGVISLSHVALTFPPEDLLYGRRPPDDEGILFLGQMAIRGERGLLRLPLDWLVRMRHNPFYDYMEGRVLAWIESSGTKRAGSADLHAGPQTKF
jgi:alpha-beta hydrolase superfamily lysophospholipase